jgi:hypothetical protein
MSRLGWVMQERGHYAQADKMLRETLDTERESAETGSEVQNPIALLGFSE